MIFRGKNIHGFGSKLQKKCENIKKIRSKYKFLVSMRDYQNIPYHRNVKSSFKNIQTLRIRIFLDSSENFKLLFGQEEPSPVSYRTLVYMVVWACMMFWMLTLGFVMITDNTATIGVDLNTSNRRSHTLENLNKFIGKYFFSWFSINIFLWMYLFTYILNFLSLFCTSSSYY